MPACLASRSWRGGSTHRASRPLSAATKGLLRSPQVSLPPPAGGRLKPSMCLLRRLHDLGQHPVHILGMHEEDQRAMRPDARFAEHPRTLRLEPGLGFENVGHLVAHMMLPPGRVLGDEGGDRRTFIERLDQLDLRPRRPILARRIDKTHLHPLRGQVERFMDLRRAHHIAIISDALFQAGRGDADMVETAEFHIFTLSRAKFRRIVN